MSLGSPLALLGLCLSLSSSAAVSGLLPLIIPPCTI